MTQTYLGCGDYEFQFNTGKSVVLNQQELDEIL